MVAASNETQPPRGLRCPDCGSLQWETDKTRPAIGGVRRRRVCKNCRRVLITYERPAFDQNA